MNYITLWGNDFTWADRYANGRLADMVALMALYEATEPTEINLGLGAYDPNFYRLRCTLEWHIENPRRIPGVYELRQLRTRTSTGSLPPEFGFLTELEVLKLDNNPGLTGCIPATLSRIKSSYEGELPFCDGAHVKKSP